MASGLKEISPTGRLQRVGRLPDPWAWPDWSNAASDGTFGNRYDDPQSSYRVLYAASDRLGAFVEVLARFRPDPHVLKELQNIAGDEDRSMLPGQLDISWLEQSASLHQQGLGSPAGVKPSHVSGVSPL